MKIYFSKAVYLKLLAFTALIILLGSIPWNAVKASSDTTQGYKLPRAEISEKFPFKSHNVKIGESQIHYVESGKGEPVVFIHGNPTSSYLWRNVIPHVSPESRAIALDLIGMGKSGKPKIAYTYEENYQYLEAFIKALALENITLVLHDWGAALGFDYARRNPGKVKAIAFMEGVLPPFFPQPSFEAMGSEMGNMFKAFKHPIKGRELLIEQNMFVEKILPTFINRTLSPEEMDVYRAPFLDKASREPVLAWPKSIPIAGVPAETVKVLGGIEQFMKQSELPMLLLYASPGVIIPPNAVPWYTGNIRNLETGYIGQGFHYLQEDQPEAIGRTLADWIRRH